MPDTPTPNPSDPDSQESGKAKEGRPRLKLKRLIVKDLEINPHINPDAEPVPHAIPASEPEPEPEIKPIPVQPPMAELETPPAEEKVSEEPEEETEAPEATEPEKEEPVAEEVPPKQPEKKAAKRNLAKKVFPVVLIAGSLIYGIHIIFDPLGLKKPEPIVPREIPIAQPDPEVGLNPIEPVEDGLDIKQELSLEEEFSLTDYLSLLEEQEIRISSLPEGVFINSVFYSPGASLNPDLGLSYMEVQTGTESHLLLVVDNTGTIHEIPFN